MTGVVIAFIIVFYVLGGILGSFILSRVLPIDEQHRDFDLKLAITWGPLSLLWAMVALVFFRYRDHNPYVHHNVEDCPS